MLPGLMDLIGIKDSPTFVLISARVSGLFLAAPLWSMPSLPKSVKGAAIVVLSAVLIPVVPAPTLPPDDPIATAIVLASETMIGIAIGLTGAFLMQGVVLAGEVASLQMGLSLGAALGGLPEGATVGVGQLKGYFALTIYLTVGGHLTLYQGLAASFAAIPPGRAVFAMGGLREVVDLGALIFSTAVRAAAPIIVALLLANIALAIVGKAVPQLNVMMLASPITISLGLLVLGASLPYLANYLTGAVAALPDAVGRTLQGFTAAAQAVQ